MVFRTLGQFIRRAWPIVLAFWGLLLLATWLAAPPWEEVAQDQEFELLPADMPSRIAGEVYARAFPEDQTASNIAIVLRRSTEPNLDRDLRFVEEVLEPRLRQIAESHGGF